MINKIKSYIFKGHEQSVSVKWNVSLSIFITYFIPWLFFSIGFIQEVNMFFFAILGITIGRNLNLRIKKEVNQKFTKDLQNATEYY